jgi:hypothetical protein
MVSPVEGTAVVVMKFEDFYDPHILQVLQGLSNRFFGLPKHRAHIAMDSGIRCLRHSFATHLLNQGTDTK